MTLYVILPRSERQPSVERELNDRVLTHAEIDEYYPKSPHEQPFLNTLLACVRQERAERRARVLGAGAITLEQKRRELDQITFTFARIVVDGLHAIGLAEGEDLLLHFRSKDPDEIARKHTVGAYRLRTRNRPWHALPDLPAGELVLKRDSNLRPCDVMDALQHHWDVPATYPGGQVAREEGRTSHISVEGFSGRKLRLAFWHDGEVHIGEIRIWDEDEKAADNDTRPQYLDNRNEEHEEALAHFRELYQDDTLDLLPATHLY